MSDLLYYGVWIDWSRGKVHGSTITLSPRGAGFLVAFLAIFVSITGGSVWRILAFLFHQQRTTKTPRDGLHYQQQALLRNAATPGVALWQLSLLFYPWRNLSKRPFLGTLPIFIVSLFILVGFFTAGILVAEVTRAAGTEVLVRSDKCGNWSLSTSESIAGFQTKTLNDTITAANYARACYGGPSNSLQCNQYQVQSLPYVTTENVSCPFAEGMCFDRYPAFSLDTGNISSQDHFGINAKPEERIYYRRKTVCAPVLVNGFDTEMNYTDALNASIGEIYGQDGDVVDLFNYGPVIFQTSPRQNFTFAYNRHAATIGYGYNLFAIDYTSGDGEGNMWRPLEPVLRDDGDVSLMFLAANNLLYYGQVEDPIFRATVAVKSVIDNGKNITFYTSNFFVNTLGCVDQHQFCNPTNQRCTKLDSYSSAVRSAQANLELNSMQYVTVSTMSIELYLSIIAQSIGGRSSAALRAQEAVAGLLSGPLPKDQWKKEVEYWFTSGLAKLQKAAVEYATGPSNVVDGAFVSKPNDTAAHQLCNSQKIKAPPGSVATSFSTLGVALILGLGGLIIFIHLILEFVISNIVPTRNYELLRWALDDKLQLQRLAFEGVGLGTWNANIGGIPHTTSKQVFGIAIRGGKEHPNISSFADEPEEGEVTISQIPESYASLTPTLHGNEEHHSAAPSTRSTQLQTMWIETDEVRDNSADPGHDRPQVN